MQACALPDPEGQKFARGEKSSAKIEVLYVGETGQSFRLYMRCHAPDNECLQCSLGGQKQRRVEHIEKPEHTRSLLRSLPATAVGDNSDLKVLSPADDVLGEILATQPLQEIDV